ncbi:hypothetical protein ACI7YT_11220 [Microbacterium sp. M]|uniref:hypothetical protein n=1 Tax=Microbacterium sp. M TaxID=3377125 RepID=UPI003866A02A
MRTAMAVTLAVTMLLLAGCATTAPAVSAGGVEGWIEADDFPLEARGGPVTVWTGEEILVVGGELGPPCPPNADCVMGPSARDGAALDPETGVWRELAEAPRPVAPFSGVFAAGRVFAWADEDGIRGGLLSYSVAEDRWTESVVPDDLPRTMVADGDQVLFPLASHEMGAGADLVLEVESGEWSELPDDPLGATFDRYLTPTPDGILLTAKALVENPGAEEPAFVQVALFDRETGSWQRLPDLEQIGGWNWTWTGDRVVDATLGGGDGGEVGGWGRAYPFGGMVRLPDGEWSPLPDAPERVSDPWLDNATGEGRFVVADGYMFDDVEETWTPITSPTGAPDVAGTAVWADERLVVVGGTDWSRVEGTRDERTWILTPPQ